MKNKIFFTSLLVIFSIIGVAQSIELSIDRIMQDPDNWIGNLPDAITWSDDSKTVYFNWKQGNDLYKIDVKDLNPEKISTKDQKSVPQRNNSYSTDGKRKIYIKSGDIYIYNIQKDETQQITYNLGNIRSAVFSSDEKEIIFEQDDNLFLWSFDDGSIKKLTNIQENNDKSWNKSSTEEDQWYEDQQKELFQYFSKKRSRNGYRNWRGNYFSGSKLKPFYKTGTYIMGLQLDPTKRYVTLQMMQSQGEEKQTQIMHYVTESGYATPENSRAKVGAPEDYFDLYLIDLKKDTTYKLNSHQIPGIKEWPEYFKEYGIEKNENRQVSFYGPQWSNDGKYAVVEVRSLDNKDRWIMLLDPETGNLELLDRQHDEAWIAGPGIGGWFNLNINWMPDNKTIWFQSEESGYSHLYMLNVETKQKTALTSGNFEIYDASISRDNKYFYFTSNEEHPGLHHFYKMSVNGGKRIKITQMEGNNEVTLSPDEKWLAIRYSYTNKPWELYIQENKPGAQAIKMTSSLTEEFKSYDWRDPVVMSFKAKDGTDVYARLYRPENDVKNGAAVIFVHGAGYLQNAHKWWSSYFREYMFHNLLADKGYTVLDIDYRGSAGYGSDFRTGIYRHMGGKDLSDIVDGTKWVIENEGIDNDRIGIYGGSYGGFITLMALFTEPEVFAAGAALRSVTDWSHYNHYYTSNILNTPITDSIAYRKSSPIYYAEGLNKPLLMCHGMVDDNVQFQDIIRLTQRLIELGKEDWELAVYPVEPHSFTEPSSWTDEYKRILKLFEENLKKK